MIPQLIARRKLSANCSFVLNFLTINSHYLQTMENAFCELRFSQRKLSAGEFNHVITRVKTVLKIKNFDDDVPPIDIFWYIIRPGGWKEISNMLSTFGFKNKTIRNYIQSFYRLARCLFFNDFIDQFGLGNLSDNDFLN